MSLLQTKWMKFAYAPLFASIVSCGGGGSGGGDSVAGIGGTGVTVTGTIDGFGSIFVNGVEFETDAASIVVDSESSSEDSLRLGMVVTVRGTIEQNGIVGTANSVEFDDDVQGPIAAISTDPDGTTKTLNVMGVTVIVDKGTTVFDDVSFDTLAINDVVEVSGLFNAASELIATRIEKKETFISGTSEIELKGVIANLTSAQFSLGDFNVDFSTADLSDVPGGVLSDGLSVEVKGTLSGTTITASRIEEEDDVFGENEDSVSIEGYISNFVDASNFVVSGQQVDASNAQRSPTGLNLQNGLKVQVEGAIINGVLVANEVEARGGEVRLSGPVQNLDLTASSGEITLNFGIGSITVSVNAQTQLRDETDTFDILTLADIRVGDFLELRAFPDGDDVIATEIRLEEADDNIVQGPVESFVAGVEITLLGLTFATPGEIFENANDMPIPSSEFFNAIAEGTIVKIKDDNPGDGVANEVELED